MNKPNRKGWGWVKTKKFSSDEKKAGKIKKCLQTEYTVDKKKECTPDTVDTYTQ